MIAATKLRDETVSTHAHTRHQFLVIALLTVAVLIGVFFRFFNIDRRFYWADEACTSLYISGHTKHEYLNFIGQGRVTTVRHLSQYQTPDGSRNLVVKELSKNGAQYPFIYYFSSRLWAECFGASPSAMRTLSALLSLLLLPATYWLCIELFRSRMVACIALAVVALSPIQIAYAQNAHEYAFWLGLVALTSACSLRALRINDLQSWVIYTATLVLSLYTNPLTVLVTMAHAVSAFLTQLNSSAKMLPEKISPAWAQMLSCTVATLVFAPWVWAISQNLDTAKSALQWMTTSVTLKTLARDWTHHVVAFMDLKQEGLQPMLLQLVLCAAIFCAAVYFLRRAPARAKFHVSALTLCTLLPLLLADLIFGGIRSTVIRLLFPLVLSMYIVVSYTLARMIIGKCAVRTAGAILLILMFAGELASCYANSQRVVRYEMTVGGQDLSQMAQAINQYNKPLIIVDSSGHYGQVLSIMHLLRPDTPLLLYPTLDLPNVPPQFESGLLFNPNPDQPFSLPSSFQTTPIDHNVYKINKQAPAHFRATPQLM